MFMAQLKVIVSALCKEQLSHTNTYTHTTRRHCLEFWLWHIVQWMANIFGPEPHDMFWGTSDTHERTPWCRCILHADIVYCVIVPIPVNALTHIWSNKYVAHCRHQIAKQRANAVNYDNIEYQQKCCSRKYVRIWYGKYVTFPFQILY